MGQVTTTEVHDFTGGMATTQAPHLIAANEAQELVNVDIRVGSLSSLPKLMKNSDLVNGPHFFNYLGTIYSHSSFRNNVLWDNKWYWSDGVVVKKVLEDGTEKDLGLPTPSDILTMTEGIQGYPHTGSFKYTYTFYDKDNGVESAPAPLPNYIDVVEQSIILDNFQTLPTDATHYRLYRIGGYLPVFTLVDEFTPAFVPYEDILDDTSIDGRLLTTLYTGPPPSGLNYLTELNGRMYGAVGNLLYWSSLGNPDSWYVNNTIKFAESITGLAVTQSGVIVFTVDQCNVLRGTGIENFALKRLSDYIGCSDHKSISQIGKNAIWFAKGYWAISDGYTVESLTYDKIDIIRSIAPRSAVVKDNTYLMIFGPALYPANALTPGNGLYPNAPQGTSDIQVGAVAIDFKRGRGYSFGLWKLANVASVGIIRDALYFGRQLEVKDDPNCVDYEVLPLFADCAEIGFAECASTIPCSTDGPRCARTTVYDLANFNYDEGLERLHYISPQSIDGSRTNLKEYEKFRIVFSGTFRVKVILDNGDIVIDELITSIKKTDDFVLLGVPKNNNKSYSVTVDIEGKGIVDSIQYTWKPRELV